MEICRNFASKEKQDTILYMDKETTTLQIVITPPATLLDMQEHMRRTEEIIKTAIRNHKFKLPPQPLSTYDIIKEAERTGRPIADVAEEHGVKKAYCFISVAKEKKISESELKKTMRKRIDDNWNMPLLNRLYAVAEILEIVREFSLDLGKEYNKKLKELPKQRPNEPPVCLTIGKKPTQEATVRENQIDISRLKNYFKASFTRDGGGFDILNNLLKGEHDNKWYAILAHQIFTSKYLIKDTTVFAKWYRTFCEIVGCDYIKSYKPSKLKPANDELSSFIFLHT